MVYLCSWTTFIFFVFSILTFYLDLILGSFLNFLGPNGLFFGLGKGLNTVLGYTHVVEQLSFSMFPSILTFDFNLILWLDNCFGICSCSWTTFIFYVSFNSEIWFWLTFGGHFFIFGGPHGLFLGFGVGLKNCFEVYLYSWTILSMYVSVNSDICFCLILGYFLTFWGLKRLFWGWGRVWQLFWGLLR